MTMHKALHLRDDVDNYVCQEKEEEEKELPALKIALKHRYKVSKAT